MASTGIDSAPVPLRIGPGPASAPGDRHNHTMTSIRHESFKDEPADEAQVPWMPSMASTLVEFVRPHLHALEAQDASAMQHVLELGALVWNVSANGRGNVAGDLEELTRDFSGRVPWGLDAVRTCVAQLHARKSALFKSDRRQFVAVLLTSGADGTPQLQVAGALPAEVV